MDFTARNYSSTDFDRLVNLYKWTAEHLSLLENSYSEFLVQKLKRPGYDPLKNLFLAETDNELVGYANLVYEEKIKRALAEVFVIAPCRCLGMGKMMMGCLIRRSQELGAKSLLANVSETNQEGLSFLTKQSFSVVRSFRTLCLDVSSGSFIEGDIRGSVFTKFRIGEEEELMGLQNRIFSGSWGFCPNTVEEIRYYLQLTGCRIDEVMCLKTQKQKIGYVWPHRIPKENGELYMRIHMFGIDPRYRGQGLGKKILQAAVSRMIDLGAKTVELTVDAENTPAVFLYDSLGFKLISQSIWYEKKI